MREKTLNQPAEALRAIHERVAFNSRRKPIHDGFAVNSL